MFRKAEILPVFFLISTLLSPEAFSGDRRAEKELAIYWRDFRRNPDRLDAELSLISIFDMWDLVGPKKVMKLLARAVNHPEASVQARERARHLLAQSQMLLGQVDVALASYKKRGFLANWLVAGPFDNEGGGGFSLTYPPEEAKDANYDMEAPMPGKNREVFWRAGPKQISHLGYNHINALFEPNVNVCGFALTTLKSQKAGRAVLRMGAGGAFKAYWNGRKALADSSYRRPGPDRQAAIVRVNKGINRLLVKICTEEDHSLGFYARLTDMEAKPWDIEPLANQTQALEKKTRRGAKPRPLAQPLQLILLRAKKNPGNALFNSSAARFLTNTNAIDHKSHLARNLARSACRLESTTANCLLWSELAMDRNESRAAIERARKKETDSIETLLALAGLEREGANPGRANKYIDRALSMRTGDLRAEVLQIEVLGSMGFFQTALEKALKLKDKFPDTPLVIDLAQNLAQRSNRAKEALKLAEQGLRLKYVDVDKHEILARAALARKDLETFEQHLAALSQLTPFDKGMYKLKSEMLQGAGYYDRAIKALETRIELANHDADAWKEMGLFLLMHGHTEEGIKALTKAMEIKPQDAWVTNYMSFLKPRPRFEEPYVVLPQTFLKMRGQSKEGKNEQLLVDQTVVRVFDSGLSSRFRQIVVELKTREAVRNWRHRWIQFTPASQQITVKKARVFRKDGTIENSLSRGIVPVSEPWYRLYYDIEAQIIEMPPLVPGDVVELVYRLDDIARRNAFNDYFGDFVFIEEEVPKTLWRYVLITPSTRRFYFNEPKYARLVKSKKKKGNSVHHVFEAGDIKSIDAEYSMPGLTSAASHLHVSTYVSWEELGDWYRNLIRHQLVPDERIREKVAEITAGATSDGKKVEAIYQWVVNATRYVGLEFGIHGYKPYRAPLVVSRGFGDCKDKASLLASMIREAGIEAEFVLVRTQDLGNVESFPASLAVFNHAIVHVPSLDLWLDGTAEHHGQKELPFGDQGATALRIHKDEAIFVKTPVMPPKHNASQTSIDILLDPDGDARLEVRTSIGGHMAAQLRQSLEAVQTRKERFEALLAQTYPGARLGNLDFESLGELSQPVVYRYTAFVPAFAKAYSSSLEVPVDVGLDLQARFGRLHTRKHDLLVGSTNVSVRSVVVKIPEGFETQHLPSTAIIESRFGSLSLNIQQKSDSLKISRNYEQIVHLVSKEDYPDFLDFCRRVDDALKGRIRLQRVK